MSSTHQPTPDSQTRAVSAVSKAYDEAGRVPAEAVWDGLATLFLRPPPTSTQEDPKDD